MREQKCDDDKFSVILRCLQRNSVRSTRAGDEQTALGYNTNFIAAA